MKTFEEFRFRVKHSNVYSEKTFGDLKVGDLIFVENHVSMYEEIIFQSEIISEDVISTMKSFEIENYENVDLDEKVLEDSKDKIFFANYKDAKESMPNEKTICVWENNNENFYSVEEFEKKYRNKL